ncbi:MAG: hydrogenase [Verrucomicrobia bacterium]|nr:MAG: hydrogenase [Verrucomicrobiota bacterium]
MERWAGINHQNLNLLIGLAIGLNLLALSTSRLPMLIRSMSAQGVILGVMPILMEPHADWRVLLVALATIGGKGLFIPGMLRRAMRAVRIDRELEPLIGFVPSLLLGAGGTIAAFALTPLLPLLAEHADSLLVPGALATVITGLILLIGRTEAVAQVCGYIILDNGIYLFGLLLIRAMPLMVEAGVLLDLTVGVFILGIIVDRIQRTFDSLDTRILTTLHE